MTSAPENDLRAMAEAAKRASAITRRLAARGGNVVSELLPGRGEFYQWDRYPEGGVYDPAAGAQYYYHAHPPGARADVCGAEHGHFHTFMRTPGAEGAENAAGAAGAKGAAPGPPSHLIAVSMDRRGAPVRLFTTNRWVTGETWRDAAESKRLLRGFGVAQPSAFAPVNGWLAALLVMFRPVIERLMDERDAAVAAAAAPAGGRAGRRPQAEVFEDRSLEITSWEDISFDARAAEILAALKKAAAGAPAEFF